MTALRSQMYGMLRKLGGVFSSNALLVPLDREDELDSAMAEVQRMAREHNSLAKNHYIRPVVVPAAVLGSQAEAVVKQLTYDLQDLLSKMKDALDACDAEKIETLAKAVQVKSMTLEPGMASGALAAAMQDAKKAASVIRREMKKKGKDIVDAKIELRRSRLGATVDTARMMFLEYSVPRELEATRGPIDRINGIDDGVTVIATAPATAVPVDMNRFDM